MDTYSSGEDLVIKTRKPYTITKQRERWTEEEHNRFLEALKLYGRAWQRIEEHIGTKTAVQIRSHAQKFFSKLEKEAVAKGVPMGRLDIDIPPPRPKRKPSNPYPRKTGVSPTPCQLALKDGKLSSPVSLPHCKPLLDLEKEPLPEKPNEEQKQTNVKEKQDDSCSDVITLLQDAHCSSVSSVNKNSIQTPEALKNSCSFREFVPPMKNGINQDSSTESYVTNVLEGNLKLDKPDTKQTVQENGTSNASKPESCSALPTDQKEGVQNYPRHVPVHVLDGSLKACMQTSSDVTFQEPTVHGHPNFCTHPATSTTAEHQNNEPRFSAHPSFLNYPPPFTPNRHNQDDYRSFLSSTFSNLIVSTLLQNPAAHAAATFAATFWPYANANVESSADSPACAQGGFLPRQTNSAPSVAAIAAATVAAATAWWTAHGLLPLCAPPHTAFTCPPNSATANPLADADQVPVTKADKNETGRENPPMQDQQLDLTKSEALQAQNPASKSPALSVSDSEESGGPKQNTGPKATDHEMPAAQPEIHDVGKANNSKRVDRSSCGSNTSGSEPETDALEKLEKDKEESKEADANNPAIELSSRRGRNGSNVADAWKEVSEEGRLAFRALFSRERLPQSFSPPHDLKRLLLNNDVEVDKLNRVDKDESASQLNLDSNTWRLFCNHHEAEKNTSPTVDYMNNEEEGPLTLGLGHGKLKARRTGFKPYKRCSMEAKENMTASIQGEEKCTKRIRLEGEPST
ncbi:protein LATE ELONGATED HYPOCOTYL [Euphorbia lathyris]|uniref:protein LATE ELONGATED HYPOCOTYL n=1 Tax=Euphorbia lathyris TaxID=212925 RepID=UPI0033144B05